MKTIFLFNEEAKIVNGDITHALNPLISHKEMKEPIKMHVEFSLLYITFILINKKWGQRYSKQKEVWLSGFNTSFEHCWQPLYDQMYRQKKIVVDFFFTISLEFLTLLN